MTQEYVKKTLNQLVEMRKVMEAQETNILDAKTEWAKGRADVLRTAIEIINEYEKLAKWQQTRN